MRSALVPLLFLPGLLATPPSCQLIASGIGQKIESPASLITSVTSATIQDCIESCCRRQTCNSLSFSMAQPENNCALHQCDNGSANLSCPQVFDARFNSGFVAVPPTTTVTAATSPLPETTEFFRSDRNISDLAAWWQQQPQQNDSSGGPTADNSGSGVASGDPQQIGLTTFVLSVSLLGALLLVSLALNAAQLHFYRQLNRRQKVYQTASVDRLQGKFTTAF